MELTCPKCQGTMRSYERSGVTVDACNDCRGIFLDHGELRRLMDAETDFYTPEPRSTPAPVPGAGAAPAYGSPAPGSAPPESYRARPYRDDEDRDGDRDRYRDDKDRYREVKDRYRDEKDRYRDDKDRYRDDRGGWGRSEQYDPRRKKKRSFLEELFD